MHNVLIQLTGAYRFWMLITVFIVAGWSSCYYDVEEELYPSLECQTAAVTYSGTILNILEQACYGCHDRASNFGNVTLEGYDNLRTLVDNGMLLGVIRHEPGFSPMPKNRAQLIECDIEKVEAWINGGALNN